MIRAKLDEQWMRHALRLAKCGQGSVEPNPMVGSVVLDADGEFVGEGWHEKFGEAHAEIHSLNRAGERAKGGTLYVTLEPCCHYGKTPPCTDAILRSGVKRVVAAMSDPFPKVAGGGIDILRNAGLEVTIPVCESEAIALNAPYLKLLRTSRPWVHLKWAMTLDGRIATRSRDSKWISSERSRRVAHVLRGRMDAILVGRGTVLADDPLLTARPGGPRTASRVIVTASGQLPVGCQLFQSARDVPVVIYTDHHRMELLQPWVDAGAEIVGLAIRDRVLSVDAILEDLGRRRMTNILVEGGAGLLGSFLDARQVDEAHIFMAPKLFGGTNALSPVGGQGVDKVFQAVSIAHPAVTLIENDLYVTGRVG